MRSLRDRHPPRSRETGSRQGGDGVGTGLILDEFSLWLNLADVYWQRRGRESVEAIVVFAAVLLSCLLVRPYGSAVWRHRRSGRSR